MPLLESMVDSHDTRKGKGMNGKKGKKAKTPTLQQSLEDRIDRPTRPGWATLSSGGRVKRPLPGCP